MLQHKKTILFLDQYCVLQGGQKVLLDIMHAFLERGYRCIVALPEKGPLSEKAEALSIETVFLPVGYYSIVKKNLADYLNYVFRAPFLLFKLARFIKKNNVEIVYANGARTFPWATGACCLLRLPLVWHIHSIFDQGMSRKICLFFGGFKTVKKIFAVSKAAALPLETLGEKVEVVYNAVTVSSYSFPRANLLKKEFNLPADACLIGTVAILEEWKNQEDLIRAASLLKGSGKQNIYFFLVGDSLYKEAAQGEYKKRLKSLVIECGLEKEVIFTGFRNDIKDVINSLDILVICSKTPDPCPLVSLEAASLGVTVISADSGGTKEIFLAKEEAFFYKAGDFQGLSDNIAFLVNNREIMQSVGERAREKVTADFNLENYLQRIVNKVEGCAYGN
jgi:glycosyltransferase involved in cell wall biosynthesis